MSNRKSSHLLVGFAFASVLLAVACSPSAAPSPEPTVHVPTYAQITPAAPKQVGDLSTTIEVPPFPYSNALAPSVISPLDGLYFKTIPLEATPTPCKRCAGYRLEGGVWTLYFDKGIYKIFLQATTFESVGSFVVTGNQIGFSNDPYCEEDLAMIGKYSWAQDAQGSLRFTLIDDLCSYKLRAKNLTADVWRRVPTSPQERAALCQPLLQAALGDPWKKPPFCH